MSNAGDLSYIKNVHIRHYATACQKLHIPYRLDLDTRALYVTTKSGKEILCYKAATPLNIESNSLLAKDKRALLRTVTAAGLPTPMQIRVRKVADLEKFFEKHQKIVVKPLDGSGGKGITILPSAAELKLAFERAKKISSKVIAETFITGKNYRFLVLDGAILAVALRIPPLVHGDGTTDLRTLIEDYNIENKAQGLPRVQLTDLTLAVLAKQGMTLDTVVPPQQEVYLRLTANLSLGGSVRDITAQCLDSYKTIALQAAKATGLRLAGVDMIAEDVTKENGSAYIIEVNSAPGMRIHYNDPDGAKLDVAVAIMKKINEL